jgi:hypothetical protein
MKTQNKEEFIEFMREKGYFLLKKELETADITVHFFEGKEIDDWIFLYFKKIRSKNKDRRKITTL